MAVSSGGGHSSRRPHICRPPFGGCSTGAFRPRYREGPGARLLPSVSEGNFSVQQLAAACGQALQFFFINK